MVKNGGKNCCTNRFVPGTPDIPFYDAYQWDIDTGIIYRTYTDSLMIDHTTAVRRFLPRSYVPFKKLPQPAKIGTKTYFFSVQRPESPKVVHDS